LWPPYWTHHGYSIAAAAGSETDDITVSASAVESTNLNPVMVAVLFRLKR
jgi:hypothetical protein